MQGEDEVTAVRTSLMMHSAGPGGVRKLFVERILPV
jgi:hypothetical protein